MDSIAKSIIDRYSLSDINPENTDEVSLFLLDRLVEETEAISYQAAKANKHIRVIKGIMVGVLIAYIVFGFISLLLS